MSLMKAVERLQRQMTDRVADEIESIVTHTVADLGRVRYAQGVIAGLREAAREIEDMRKRYDEGDDENDGRDSN